MANDLPEPADELVVTMVLAEAAQVADGKLNLLGGGVAVIPPRPQPMASPSSYGCRGAVRPTPSRGSASCSPTTACRSWRATCPSWSTARSRPARPSGWPEGQSLPVPVVINFSALPVEPGKAYRWRLAVDGASDDAWVADFSVAPEMLTA